MLRLGGGTGVGGDVVAEVEAGSGSEEGDRPEVGFQWAGWSCVVGGMVGE